MGQNFEKENYEYRLKGKPEKNDQSFFRIFYSNLKISDILGC